MAQERPQQQAGEDAHDVAQLDGGVIHGDGHQDAEAGEDEHQGGHEADQHDFMGGKAGTGGDLHKQTLQSR